MTLDAGGTNFVFSAMAACKEIVESIRFDSSGNDLRKSLGTIIEGFRLVKQHLYPAIPTAISIAFPGPCSYRDGIVWDQKNLKAYQGGIPLKYLLEKEFQIPVIMNNDADLFTYGEAKQGLLKKINRDFENRGNKKRFENLIGISLGTGFGAGIVMNGNLLQGDNSSAGEVWAFRSKKHPYAHAETTLSAKGLVNTYKRFANITSQTNLTAKSIAEIAHGNEQGNMEAAVLAFNEFGEVLGDALVNMIALIDGIVVIGGGLSHAYDLFSNALIKELNSQIKTYEGNSLKRLTFQIYNLENPDEYKSFSERNEKTINVPFSNEKFIYDDIRRIGIGKSHHETSHSIAIGAYLTAVDYLNITK